MEFESLNDIIDFAIKREAEAEAFYNEIHAEESMSGIKDMLKEFAEMEKHHQQMLTSIREKGVVSTAEVYKFKWIVDLKRSDYVSDLTYQKGMGYNEILMVAMKREEQALKLYNMLEEKAENEDQVRIFRILAQEEAKHKLKFETLYDDYMAEMGD